MAIPEWLKISPSAGIGDKKVTLTADSNTGTGAREYVLTAETAYGKQATCRVLQSGAEEILRVTSVPEFIEASALEFYVEGESNAASLHFLLPGGGPNVTIADIEIDGTPYEYPFSTFEVPGNPGAEGIYQFRIHYVLDEENDTVEDQELQVGVYIDSSSELMTVTRRGQELTGEDPAASLEIPAAGKTVETEELPMGIRDDISGIYVHRPYDSGFAGSVKIEVCLGYLPSVAPVEPGGVSTQDLALSPYRWTSWYTVSSFLQQITKPSGAVCAYKLRLTVPENTEYEPRTADLTVSFTTSHSELDANIHVSQEAAPKLIEGSTSVKVVNNSGAAREGRCYLTLRTSAGASLNICSYLGGSVASGSSYTATGSFSLKSDTAFAAKYLNLNLGYSGKISVSLKIGSRTVSGTLTGGGDLTLSSVLNMNPGSTYNVTGTITLTN